MSSGDDLAEGTSPVSTSSKQRVAFAGLSGEDPLGGGSVMDDALSVHSSGSSAQRHARSGGFLNSPFLRTKNASFAGSVTSSGGATSSSHDSNIGGMRIRLTVFDRVPMLYYMLLLLGVPVIIIIITQAIYMDTQLKSINFFHDHAEIVEAVTHCNEELRHEAIGSTQFLATDPNNVTAAAEAAAPLAEHRSHSVHECDLLHDLVFHSKLPKLYADKVRDALVEAGAQRASIDARAVTDLEAREALLTPLTDIADVFAALEAAEELQPMSKELQELMITQLWQNWMSICRSSGISIIRLGANVPDEYYREIDRCIASAENYETLFRSLADATGERYLAALDNDPKAQVWKEYMALVVTQNYTIYGHLQEDDWIDEFTYTLDKMLVLDHEMVHEIEDADALHRNVYSAAIQMSMYVAACAVTTVFVTIMQRRFSHRMDLSLDRSRALNKGVQRFVPRNQLKLMGVRSIMEISPGDHVEVASTMLFSDIRQFTTISERMTQSELFDWLQSYFASMTNVVEENHGYVDKFIGDALFCVFSNPNNAVDCGVSMQQSVEQLNAQLNADGQEYLVRIGVGIHHGIVAAGVFGDEHRLACTLVSSDVNLASRLEGVTKAYGAKIIVSEAVYERIDIAKYACRCLGELQVAGSGLSVTIYEIYQNDPLPVKRLKIQTKAQFEKAIGLRKTDPARAREILREIQEEFEGEELHDLGVQAKIGQLQRADSSADKFGKHGTPDQQPLASKKVSGPNGMVHTPEARHPHVPLALDPHRNGD